MKTTRRIALALALVAVGWTTARAQTTLANPVVGGLYDEERLQMELSDAAWRIGVGLGPSIGNDAILIQDLRMQGRLFLRRQFNDLLQAEAGVGIHRLAGNKGQDDQYDNHFWSLDARGMIAPAIGDQWNPYFSAGVGFVFWRIIDPADETLALEWDFAVREEGIGIEVPLAIGLQFKPENHSRFAFGLELGYMTIFDDEIDGKAGGGNHSMFSGLLSLEYLFHDEVEEYRDTVQSKVMVHPK